MNNTKLIQFPFQGILDQRRVQRALRRWEERNNTKLNVNPETCVIEVEEGLEASLSKTLVRFIP